MADLWSTNRIACWAELNLLQLVRKVVTGDVNVNRSLAGLLRATLPRAFAEQLIAEIDHGSLNSATLDVDIPFDVAHCATTFALNTLPSCVLSLPVGRVAQNVYYNAVSEFLGDYLKSDLRMKVWATVEPTSGRDDGWPTEDDGSPRPFLVFDGYTVGASFRKAFGQADFTIHLTHWLSRLNFASALSRLSSPANPVSISYNSALASHPSAIFAPQDAALSVLQRSMGNTEVIGVDFWGRALEGADNSAVGGLKTWLEHLANQDRFNWNQINSTCPRDLNPVKNLEALEALRRIEPLYQADENLPDAPVAQPGAFQYFSGILVSPGWDGLTEGGRRVLLDSMGYTYGVPVPMYRDATLPVYAVNIANQVGQETVASIANSTLWDRLVSAYCPEFNLAVVPMIDRALTVPVTPGLQSVWRSVNSDEYFALEHRYGTPRPVRAVGLVATVAVAAGGALNPGVLTTTGAMGVTHDTCKDGLILLKNGPRWMTNIILFHNAAPTATTANPTPTGQAPDVGVGVPDGVSLNSPNTPLARKFAASLFLQEVLRHRSLTVSGRLRFDIAPGSSLAVEASKERWVSASLAAGGIPEDHWLYGTVTEVTTYLNAEAQQAGTSFQLAFVRSEAENADADLSVAAHPIWTIPWRGAPLLGDPTFT